MTEAEKLDAGLEYDFTEPEVRGRKFRAVKGCQKLNGIDMTETAAREAAIRELFGSAGKSPVVLPTFHCDNGGNIHVGNNFFANYNVTILDNREVRIGDNVMIGPHTLIATVGHPLSPAKRRMHCAIAKPIRIGNDVWIGGNDKGDEYAKNDRKTLVFVFADNWFFVQFGLCISCAGGRNPQRGSSFRT